MHLRLVLFELTLVVVLLLCLVIVVVCFHFPEDNFLAAPEGSSLISVGLSLALYLSQSLFAYLSLSLFTVFFWRVCGSACNWLNMA